MSFFVVRVRVHLSPKLIAGEDDGRLPIQLYVSLRLCDRGLLIGFFLVSQLFQPDRRAGLGPD